MVGLGIERCGPAVLALTMLQEYANAQRGSATLGSVTARGTPSHHVPPHARTACPRPLNAPALVDTLLTPNCVSAARRRGLLRLELDRTAMQAHFCMGLTP